LRKILSLALAVVCCSAISSCRKQEAPGPDTWAVVNGTSVTRSDVEKYYRSRLNPEGQAPSQDEGLSLKLSILDELINNEILLERAAHLNLTATDAEVEEKFTESKAPYTEEEFQKKLKGNGLTADDLKRDLRRQLSIQKLLNREVVAKIAITDQDVNDFYRKNQQQFNVAEPQFRIATIVVTPHPSPQAHNLKNDDAKDEPSARRKIAMLEEQLAAGVDFAQLAMEYSEDATASSGGDLGFVPESALNSSDPALRTAILKMQVGEVSKPIQEKDGYRILKLIAREPAGQRSLDDPQVRQAISDNLRNRKEQLLRSAYMAVARDEAHIVNYLAQQILESVGKLPADSYSKQ
jgi:peptidyl-prolyl cis-trans isomerase SurA